MKKFLLYIVCFFVIIVSLFSLLTFVTDRGLRMSEFGNLKEWNDIFDKRIKPDIIIQGSSRAWVQFNTYLIDSAFHANSYNMGMDGTPFDVQYVKYKLCVENKMIPTVILQNVDWDTMDKNTPVFQKYQFLPYLSNPFFAKQLLKNNIIPCSDVYLPFLKYAGEPQAIKVGVSEFFGIHHFISPKHHGFLSVKGNWDGVNFEKRQKNGKIHWHRNKEVEKMFIDFLVDCHKKKINVVLVFAPLYFELADLIEDFKGLKTYYSTIAEKNSAVFLDFSLDSLSYHKDNFYNASHLNKKGADAFTRKLVNKLRYLDDLKITK